MTESHSNPPIPPGKYLQEKLDENKMTAVELGQHMGYSVRVVRRIIAGKEPIDKKCANRLSEALGSSAEYWLNLEASYQRDLKLKGGA